jgi:RNA polymerase sigma factor (sigma-70 family)
VPHDERPSEKPAPRHLRVLHEPASAGGLVDVAGWERYLAAYDLHAARLYRIALLLLGDRPDAEDAVQEVFLSAHRPWTEGRVDDLGAYLRRSLTNRITSSGRHRTVVDRFTRRRRADERGSLDVGDEATDHVALQRALAALPTKQRAAVVLRYYEGLSIAETASLLGVTDGTVKSQVSDALHTLRDVLGVHA